jgi:site-specific recombinase XerD
MPNNENNYLALFTSGTEMKLKESIYQFFVLYLPRIKGNRDNTVKAYRDAFSVFLPFAARYLSIKVDALSIEHLNSDLILAFLDHLEKGRKNKTTTRNHRLAALKSLAKMIRLMHPEKKDIANSILHIPKKRALKPLIGFLNHDEILKVFQVVDLKKKEGFRDYALLHLLYDSGPRATEVATLNLDDFDPQNQTLAILGKGNRYRLVSLWPKTVQLLEIYISKYRLAPRPAFQNCLFINQRGEAFSRYGIHRLCKKYLTLALPPQRLKNINPAHSFRHSCAVHRLLSQEPLTHIQNRLGHENIQSTMAYLHMDLSRKRQVQKKFIEYTQSAITDDPKIDELIDWENKKDILEWLDSL